MSDEMINKTKPTPRKGVPGIGDTAHVHYEEWDINKLNNPIDDSRGGDTYSKGQSKKGSK